jgi:hypothetical protein
MTELVVDLIDLVGWAARIGVCAMLFGAVELWQKENR